MKDSISLIGLVTLRLIDSNQNIKKEIVIKNAITNYGRNMFAGRVQGTSPVAPSHIGVGTGTQAFDPALTNLATQLHRQALTRTLITTNVSNDTCRCTATIPAGTATGTLTEACLANVSTTGNMISYIAIDPAIEKLVSDGLIITWDLISN